MYKRVLLKLSGEQFAGNGKSGIDSKFINGLARDLGNLVDTNNLQLAVVVGGGNFVRGKDMKLEGLDEETAHYMGMLGTVMNGLALRDVLRSQNFKVELQSKLSAQPAAIFNPEEAIQKMLDGQILIVAGGTGRPFVTTDTGAVETALDLSCDIVIKATKVDGVYDKDPAKYPEAKKIDKISHDEAHDHPDINVMDNEALAMASKHKLPIIVCQLDSLNLKKAVTGEPVGTLVS